MFDKLINKFYKMYKSMLEDLDSIIDRDPAARNRLEVMLLYSGFHALQYYRLSHWFYKKNLKFIARFISQYARRRTGVEIHPGAQIGKGLFIDHGMGVVIGETTVIGDNCTIYQNVTLGGTGKHVGKRHPTLEDNVMVGSGAKVLGPFTVKSGSRVAAGAVVLAEVPANATAVGVPAKIVRINGVKSTELDQVHVSDPVMQELCRLKGEVEMLRRELKQVKAKKSEQSEKAKLLENNEND